MLASVLFIAAVSVAGIDLMLRNATASNLAGKIEVAERILIQYQEKLAELNSRYDTDTEDGMAGFTEELVRASKRSRDAYVQAMRDISFVSVPQWLEGTERAQESYLTHAGHWKQYLELAAAGDLEGAFSQDLGEGISSSWYRYCTVAFEAVPYLDYSGVEQDLRAINEDGGCYDRDSGDFT